MEKRIRKSDLAKALGVQNAYIKTNIDRKKIHVDEDGLIDLSNSINRIFIEKLIAKGKTFDINNVFLKIKPPAKIEKNIIIDPEIKTEPKKEKQISENETELVSLAEQKMQFEVDKLRLDCELKELQKNKIEGSLVPVDAIKDVFLWSIDTFHNTYLQEVQSLAQLIKSGLSYEMTLKQINNTLEKLKDEAKQNIIAGVEGVVNEYKEVRGRGERK